MLIKCLDFNKLKKKEVEELQCRVISTKCFGYPLGYIQQQKKQQPLKILEEQIINEAERIMMMIMIIIHLTL